MPLGSALQDADTLPPGPNWLSVVWGTFLTGICSRGILKLPTFKLMSWIEMMYPTAGHFLPDFIVGFWVIDWVLESLENFYNKKYFWKSKFK